MSVLWPAFLLACLMEVLIFSMIDPVDLHWAGESLTLSRAGVYSVGFFAFWLIGIGACTLAVVLVLNPPESTVADTSDASMPGLD